MDSPACSCTAKRFEHTKSVNNSTTATFFVNAVFLRLPDSSLIMPRPPCETHRHKQNRPAFTIYHHTHTLALFIHNTHTLTLSATGTPAVRWCLLHAQTARHACAMPTGQIKTLRTACMRVQQHMWLLLMQSVCVCAHVSQHPRLPLLRSTRKCRREKNHSPTRGPLVASLFPSLSLRQ